MRFTRKSVSAAAVLLLTAALGVPPAAAGVLTDYKLEAPALAPAVDAIVAGASTVWRESIRLRGELGFSTAPTALAEALPAGVTPTDDRLYDFINNWGFIGTAEEAAEMERREALVTALSPTLDKWAAQTGYAGHFLDNARGGVLVIQFADSIPGYAETELIKNIPVDSGSTLRNIELRKVRFTSSELTTAQHTVWDSSPEHVVAVGEDITTNSLDVTLSPEATESNRAAILSLVSVPVSFDTGPGQDEACTSRTQCNSPQRGGVALNVGEAICSAGWVVKRSIYTGVVTSGHCWFGSTTGSVTSGSAGTFGSKTSLNALSNGTHADMRYLSVSDGPAWLYEDNTDKQRVVTGSSLGAVGLTACLYGRNSSTPRCGTIKSTNTSHKSSTTGYMIYGQSSATYSSAFGDSGGAVASGTVGNIARGVHSGTFGDVKHYSSIGYTSTYDLGTLKTG